MNVLITTGVLILAVGWAFIVFNRLVRLRTVVTIRWREVEVQLQRRHAAALGLADAVAGGLDAERDAADAVVAARSRALANTGPADASRKEAELSAAIARLVTLAGGRPPAADAAVPACLEEVARAEQAMTAARQAYNEVAARYNAAAGIVPGNLVAAVAGFRHAELFAASGPAAPPGQ